MPLKNFKISLIHKYIKQRAYIDTRREAPQSAFLPASLTVEAALVFPLFLFVMVGVLFFFRVLQVEHMTYGALAATAAQISLEADETEAPFVRAAGYFYYQLAEEDFPFSYLTLGKAGIKWLHTKLDGQYVDLWIQYECKLPLRVPGFSAIPIIQRVRMKKWVGYTQNTGEGQEEQWVYVTQNGSVYHLARECTHLKLSVQRAGKYEAEAAGYGPCDFCGKDNGGQTYYYITDEGDKYHTKISCRGLKRTIYMIRLSQASGKRACARCGGG